MLALWIAVAFELKVYALCLVVAVIGAAAGGFWPYVIRLVASITPYTGTVSCAFIMLYGLGDLLIVIVNGKLIDMFGAFIQPVSILAITVVIGCPLLALTLCLFEKYTKMRDVERNVADQSGVGDIDPMPVIEQFSLQCVSPMTPQC